MKGFLSLSALALSLFLGGMARAESMALYQNNAVSQNADTDELTNDDAIFIVEKVTRNQYQLSIWSGMHSHEVADFDGDHDADFIALIKSAKEDKSAHAPTHLIVIPGEATRRPFEKATDYSVVELSEGTPGDFPEGYLAVEKKDDAATFAKIGCKSERAIRMIEEASTAFYFCWNNGKFEFLRDPDDVP
jgi:hypothetical protein